MKNRIGEKHTTNEGYEIEITEYFNNRNCTVKFENGTLVKSKKFDHIKRGCVKNPDHKSVYGIGYGLANSDIKSNSYCYRVWRGIMRRCYDEKYQETHPTYKKCSVHPSWHNFKNFSEWFKDNYIEGFHLDKDILFKGNNVYAPTRCCFVPPEINLLFVKRQNHRGKHPIGVWFNNIENKFITELSVNGVKMKPKRFKLEKEAYEYYKNTKEEYIRNMAEKWKDKINSRVHEAMCNYKVEITD